MNNYRKLVCKSEYKPNCYVLVSCPQRRDDPDKVECWTSFLYDAGEIAAEWEPKYGPIQVWHKSDRENATKEHYYYDYINNDDLNFSQLAVYNNRLPQAAARGDFDYIFEVLERWTKER